MIKRGLVLFRGTGLLLVVFHIRKLIEGLKLKTFFKLRSIICLSAFSVLIPGLPKRLIITLIHHESVYPSFCI